MRERPTTEYWESPVVPWEACDASRKSVLRKLWGRGELSYKLNPSQKEAYLAYRKWEKEKDPNKFFTFDISRRWGKTFVMALIAIEDGMRNRKWRMPYISKSKEMVEEIILPVVDTILEDCPPELKPKFIRTKRRFKFHKGSQLIFVGMDYNPDDARGSHLDKGFLDEAGFINNLMYVYKSILRPQMQTRRH